MADKEQEFTTDIAASVPLCFATITQFERYPEWFSPIRATKILKRHAGGLAKQVEIHIDIKIRTLRYVLQYEYEKPTRLTWESVDGDIESIVGGYDFEKRGPALTQVTCRQAVVLGFWLPGPLRGFMERQALKQSVLEFKAAAEAAARSAKADKSKKARS